GEQCDAGNEKPAHSVAFKVHIDPDPRLSAILNRFDGAMDVSCKGTPNTLDRPGSRRMVAPDHLRPAESSRTNFPSDSSTRPQSIRGVCQGLGGHCAHLPLREVCKVRGVGKHVFRPTSYLNGLPNCFHRVPYRYE